MDTVDVGGGREAMMLLELRGTLSDAAYQLTRTDTFNFWAKRGLSGRLYTPEPQFISCIMRRVMSEAASQSADQRGWLYKSILRDANNSQGMSGLGGC